MAGSWSAAVDVLPFLCYLNYFVSVLAAAVVPSLVGNVVLCHLYTWKPGGDRRSFSAHDRRQQGCDTNCCRLSRQLHKAHEYPEQKASLVEGLGSGNDRSSWSYTESLSPCQGWFSHRACLGSLYKRSLGDNHTETERVDVGIH